MLVPLDYTARLSASALRAGFRVETFAEIESVPLLALTKRTSGPRPRIYFSAGIHGDEPAPPLALLELIDAGAFDHRAVWFLCPLLNPAGVHRRTRENAAGVDLNRDFKSPASAEVAAHRRWLERQPPFDLAICVHEDWESTGFYLYELNPTGAPSLAPAMLAAAVAHVPIEPAAVIDGRAIAEPGIIRPVADPALRDLWPESIYLQHHYAKLGYTIESPSSLPLPVRVATLRAALSAAIAACCGDFASPHA